MNKWFSKKFLATDIRAPHNFTGVHLAPPQWLKLFFLLGADFTALLVAWIVAHRLNDFYSPPPPQFVWWNWWGLPSLFWCYAAIVLIVFTYAGLYRPQTRTQNFLGVVKLISSVFLLTLVAKYFYDPAIDLPRSLFFSAWGTSIIFVILARFVISLVLSPLESRQAIPIFLIASSCRIQHLTVTLERRSQYRVVGVALASTAHSHHTLQQILASGAQEVLAEALPEADLASSLYWHLRGENIALRLLPSSRDMLYRRGMPEIFAGLPTVRVEIPLLVGLDYRLKRALDYGGALFGIVVLSPLFLAIVIAIKLSSPGPAFFRQERVGLQGKTFQMWKFRTMVVNAPLLQQQLEAANENDDGIMFKLKRDPRIIPLGHFLRRSSLDEIPQLFNVMMGQMSLVGPRPLPLRDVERFDAWHHIRHQVMPGVTGLWQISGRSDIGSFDDVARLDLYYIDNWSLNLDWDILVETVRILLFRKGAY
ncbi:glucosyltransferase [Synechocystis sp. PCC 6803]|uniref:Glucosyltransferase n=1 Tax=Synechocystis sp. (strain ATCC 27184 / PCC 6803 / Kazusa) TaxID=1111708 RepID=P74057_SYNY3|nr:MULTISPECIES: sugar transferase [unclassified Synechocystis]AGF51821.1 glucosyltransferase [Synechocystis sp. PCC 6803]ALJ67796.1 glucosyltransferase [Synechocystis sp. PCC 6803]AVP89628.1 sugar transferase [Synechocystis sp. IPPAS B-1465]MBD2618767.1 sugar transferase [Synechocystis sp. FACHB-898]MBD2640250.1 sugar transferase [Synechocystis sp. FACHB-908]